ncbi:hypothetical protein F2Q69_00037742 [Brassica cretica]|uniref:Leucine-rich repeat-containing N-terminal plant-type domain-containing protein n=1 Tax=Brassica cretica TaxID=69181 RepID=A0A8S9SQ05_BRACR|nr:hypothetical protein F2Q69_00037742 [Brassica cretica]
MKLNVVVSLILLLISTATCCPPSDLRALLAFRSALHEPYLGIFNSWTGQDCCHNWYGVSCDAVTHRVADINLRGESEDPIFERAHRTGYMTGRISPAICDLARLSALTIADWKGISGDIPKCITRLSFVRTIDLIGNQIFGEIPNDIGRLNRLAVLNVADNRISGSIPKSLTNLSSLMHLDLRNNLITGLIPTDFGRLTMLSRALLSGNRITGRIPESLTKIYRLADVDLSGNQLYGTIPPSLGRMSVLATLNLDGNKISGKIPQTLMTSSVMNLNLSRNLLQGKIPEGFGPRSYFTVLDLSYNNLKGPIPSSISGASFIGHLDLSHNHLCGRIPVGSPFDHLEAASFMFNDCLCGKPLKACLKN